MIKLLSKILKRNTFLSSLHSFKYSLNRNPEVEYSYERIIADELLQLISVKWNIIEYYFIDFPYELAAIEQRDDELIYEVITPKLDSQEMRVLDNVQEELVKKVLNIKDIDVNIKQIIEEVVVNVANKFNLSRISTIKVLYYILRRCLGFDILEPLIKDSHIEDIVCNGPEQPIYIYHAKHGFMRSNLVLSEDFLEDFVIRLCEYCGRTISYSSPIIEATLPDGSRIVSFWKREVNTHGTSFVIRKFREEVLTPIDLIINGTFTSEATAWLWTFIEAGLNGMIIGGTGSGKTTTLNALCLFIPENSRIVSIEEVREIKLPHKNWTALMCRNDKLDDSVNRRIDMMYLLKIALRLRPEYLIVGEVRGEETNILFQAMSTGHIVYSTFHAGNVNEFFTRILNPPISVPSSMLSSLHFIIVQELDRKSLARKCIQIVEHQGLRDNSRPRCHLIFTINFETNKLELSSMPSTLMINHLISKLGIGRRELLSEVSKRIEFLELLVKSRVRISSREFIKLISKYRLRRS